MTLDKYPANTCTNNIKRGIHNQVSKYSIKDDGDCLISREDNRKLLHEGNAIENITRIHQSSHFEILNTNRSVSKMFIRQDSRTLVTEIVLQACQTCQYRARIKYKKQNKGRIFKMIHKTLQMVAVDDIEPIQPQATKRGNKYILTAIDYLTRFSIGKAVKDIDEKTTANFLCKCIVVLNLVPQYILSGRGQNFISKYVKAKNILERVRLRRSKCN